MLTENLHSVLVTQHDRGGLASVVVVTDHGAYRIDGSGFATVTPPGAESHDVLPAAFRGQQVLEVRCDGEDIAIKLANGTYLSSGWLIDTSSGEGYLDVLFYGPDDVDAEFLEFYQELEPCGHAAE